MNMFRDTRMTHYILQGGKYLSVERVNELDRWLVMTWDVLNPPVDLDSEYPHLSFDDDRYEAIDTALFFLGSVTFGDIDAS